MARFTELRGAPQDGFKSRQDRVPPLPGARLNGAFPDALARFTEFQGAESAGVFGTDDHNQAPEWGSGNTNARPPGVFSHFETLCAHLPSENASQERNLTMKLSLESLELSSQWYVFNSKNKWKNKWAPDGVHQQKLFLGGFGILLPGASWPASCNFWLAS